MRKSTRIHKAPSYLQDYTYNLLVSKPSPGASYDINQCISYANINTSHKAFVSARSVEIKPEFFHQAIRSKAWQQAMDKEISALELNHTWDVVPLPSGKTPIGCKWVYKIKYNPDGSVERYKAQVVAKRYTQQEGLDYSETFSPVTKSISVRVLLCIAAVKCWGLIGQECIDL